MRESVRIILIVPGLITGEKVPWKSKPNFWWKPFATSLALYLLILSSEFSLIRNTLLQLIAVLLEGKETGDQVLLFSKASNSSFIAARHLGSCNASLTD